ncbi:MAG: ribonuclease Z [Saprospiraceae bacterium]
MRKKSSITFELLILGTSSATPSKNRYPSAQLLNIQEQLFLIDCGEATQVRLFQHKIQWNQLSHIFITHLHGDHSFGLPGLLSSMGLYNRQHKLTLVGPEGLQEFVETSLRLSFSRINFELEFITLDHTISTIVLEDDELKIISFPLDHRIPCLGYRFQFNSISKKLNKEKIKKYNFSISELKKLKNEEDIILSNGQLIKASEVLDVSHLQKSFAYCSDTRYNESILPYIENVDLLYHETTYENALQEKAYDMGHSTTLQAATIAQKANAKCLVTGHYSSRYIELNNLLVECQSIFPNTILGKENLRISI